MIRGIHHIGMNCRDMARMQKFYCDAFGFKPVDEEGFSWEAGTEMMDHIVDVKGSASKGIMLRAGTCYLELFEYSAPPPGSPDPEGNVIEVQQTAPGNAFALEELRD